MITGIYVNALQCAHEVMTIRDDLESYYELLDVSTIDIVTRKIGGKYYDIVCDDEAMLKPIRVASMIDDTGATMLVGNLFIAHANSEGEMVSLTDEDVNRILGSIRENMVLAYHGTIGNVLVGEY